jgi:hypothetical protein
MNLSLLATCTGITINPQNRSSHFNSTINIQPNTGTRQKLKCVDLDLHFSQHHYASSRPYLPMHLQKRKDVKQIVYESLFIANAVSFIICFHYLTNLPTNTFGKARSRIKILVLASRYISGVKYQSSLSQTEQSYRIV